MGCHCHFSDNNRRPNHANEPNSIVNQFLYEKYYLLFHMRLCDFAMDSVSPYIQIFHMCIADICTYVLRVRVVMVVVSNTHETNKTESYTIRADTDMCVALPLHLHTYLLYTYTQSVLSSAYPFLFSSVLPKPKWRKHSIFAACRFYPLGHFMCVYHYYYCVVDGESARMKWQKCSSSLWMCVCVGGSACTHNALCPKSDRHAQ